jgi:DNA-directed RNA polymerase specialized sigma24 family protein
MTEPKASPTAIDRPPEDASQQFEALALPHLPHLYRLALHLAAAAADAEDLVHETYVKGLHAFGRLRETTRIRAWLSPILTRLVFDRQRRRP